MSGNHILGDNLGRPSLAASAVVPVSVEEQITLEMKPRFHDVRILLRSCEVHRARAHDHRGNGQVGSDGRRGVRERLYA